MSERVLDLVDRLRGIYTLAVDDGAGLLDGKDTYTREFFVPPIHLEAAKEIERLRELVVLGYRDHIEQTAELRRLQAVIEGRDESL